MTPARSLPRRIHSHDSERRRFELFAVREAVSASEVFSRMLTLYEREHGKLEVRRADETG